MAKRNVYGIYYKDPIQGLHVLIGFVTNKANANRFCGLLDKSLKKDGYHYFKPLGQKVVDVRYYVDYDTCETFYQ